MTPATEKKIHEMLEFARTHGLTEMVWQQNDVRIAFRRSHKSVHPGKSPLSNGAGTETAPALPAAPKEEIVRSPMVGTFRRALSKERPPMIVEGNHIKPGDRCGVVECMKIPTDVVSFCQGVISKILVEDGQVVEYGQPLFAVLPGTVESENGN